MTFFFFNDTATTEIYTLSYTTLFRSTTPAGGPCPRWARNAAGTASGTSCRAAVTCCCAVAVSTQETAIVIKERSEEHTSELQSRQYLVCRLLLEKKNKNTTPLVLTIR